jgi:outer membrane receptor protein involved in Fe transport
VRWQIAPGHEVFASYAENMAMFQGGFKLGPQSVSQAVWDAQGKYLKPETSKSFDAGYRYVSGPLQVSLAAYDVKFDNRLLQYNPCPTNQQQNPGCGNSFHNAGSVTSKGAELGVLWKPLVVADLVQLGLVQQVHLRREPELVHDHLRDQGHGRQAAGGHAERDARQRADPEADGFSASLQGKYTGRRYYTYTNDQSFGGYTTFDLGLGYKFNEVSFDEGREGVAERHQPDQRALRGELRQQRVRAGRRGRQHPGVPLVGAAAGLRHGRLRLLSPIVGAEPERRREAAQGLGLIAQAIGPAADLGIAIQPGAGEPTRP